MRYSSKDGIISLKAGKSRCSDLQRRTISQTLSEAQVQRLILDWLEIQTDLMVIRYNSIGVPLGETGKFRPLRQRGVSDLICCVRGTFLAIEVKREKGGKLSEFQKDFIEQVKDKGGYAIVARSLEEVQTIINLIRKEQDVLKQNHVNRQRHEGC